MEKTEKEIKKKTVVPFRSYPTDYRKFEKNNKKTQKTKKIPLSHHFKQKQVGKG